MAKRPIADARFRAARVDSRERQPAPRGTHPIKEAVALCAVIYVSAAVEWDGPDNVVAEGEQGGTGAGSRRTSAASSR